MDGASAENDIGLSTTLITFVYMFFDRYREQAGTSTREHHDSKDRAGRPFFRALVPHRKLKLTPSSNEEDPISIDRASTCI